MKKLLKFIFFFILFLLIVLFTAPVLFKGKISDIAKEQINNNVNAKADFNELSLSFFKNFPYLNVGIKKLSVVGIDRFEGDTLLFIQSFDVAVDIISAIKMKNIEVKKIIIDRPIINALVLESGEANWDIAKETEEEVEEDSDTASSDFDATIELKTFKIANAQIKYADLKSDMSASLEDFNFELSGDLSQDYSTITINSTTDKLNFLMSGINYLTDVALDIQIGIDADLEKMNFTLQKNSFSLNNFILTLDGTVEIPDSSDIVLAMNYGTNNANFKSLLSLVPVIYTRDFEDLDANGNILLSGTIKGKIGENELPDIDGKLKVSKAMFKYPDLPKSADNIEIDVEYFYDGKQMDNTTVDVNKFHIEFGGSPIDLTLNIKTPISDPFINSQIIANIDLATFSDIIPLENTELKGLVNSQLDLMGNMSLIENEKYEEFKAEGNIKITEFFFNSPDVPKPFGIQLADLSFSPKYVDVKTFKSTMGNSDFGLNGKITDFLPFVFKDETIKGNLNFMAGTINLNELMPSEEADTDEPKEENDTATLEAIKVPSNIDFVLNSKIENLYYDKLDMKDVRGTIIIRNSKVKLEKLNMNTLSGELIVSGEYNTQDINNPLVDFNFQANEIDIAKAFSSFGILGKIAPIASKATGRVSLGMNYSSFLTRKMKPILNSIVGAGNLASQRIGVKSASAFNAIGKQLNLDEFKEMILSDIKLNYEILSGKLLVEPFDTKMGNMMLSIAGEQSFDNKMDYGINISAPKSIFGNSNSSLNALYNSNPIKGFDISKAETVNLLVKLTGDMSNPKVKINPIAGLKQTTEAIKEEFKTTAKEAIDTKKDEAKARARAEADKIISEAEKQAAEIRKQGKIAADKVRTEANINADRMVKEARNPLLKKAAQVGAKEVRAEGEKKAKRIEAEANSKANKIIETARTKSDQLLK